MDFMFMSLEDGLIHVCNDVTFEDIAFNKEANPVKDRFEANFSSVAFKVRSPEVEKVIFHDPATVVYWTDGTKTVVKCGPHDTFDPEKGLAMAIAKKHFGNGDWFHKVFKRWVPDES